MNAYATGLAPANAYSFSRAEGYARMTRFDQPTLVMDIEAVARRFQELRRGLGRAAIHYAVKANPAREIVARLIAEGSKFDCASRGEIDLCLRRDRSCVTRHLQTTG